MDNFGNITIASMIKIPIHIQNTQLALGKFPTKVKISMLISNSVLYSTVYPDYGCHYYPQTGLVLKSINDGDGWFE
jgi:hypothetical protein